MIICSAPGRAGIIGNPSDIYGGSVISCSLRERAQTIITESENLILKVGDEEITIKSNEDLKLKGDHFDIPKVVISFLRLGDLKVKITCSSQIPFQAGLSGSTALLVTVLNALVAYKGWEYNKYHLAEMARFIELNYLKVMCGYQDAYMCTFGGLNFMDFREKEYYKDLEEELYATIEPLTPFVKKLPFILAHTGIKRVSSTVHKPLRERWLEGEVKVVKAYQRMTHLAREGKKALLREDWERLGQLMNDNHALQRDLGGSGEQNERLIKAALESGALGAKLAGAGRGGTIIALHPEPENLVEALREAGAEKILHLKPSPGVTVETVDEGEDPRV